MVQHNNKIERKTAGFILLFTQHTTVAPEVTGPKRDSTRGQGRGCADVTRGQKPGEQAA